MKNAVCFVAMLAMALAVGGCKRDHEAVMKDSLSKMKEATQILKGIKDEASARSAASKLESISKDLEELEKEGSKMSKPTEAQQTELTKKYGDEMMKTVMELMSESMRLSADPKIAPIIGPAMKGVGRPVR